MWAVWLAPTCLIALISVVDGSSLGEKMKLIQARFNPNEPPSHITEIQVGCSSAASAHNFAPALLHHGFGVHGNDHKLVDGIR